MCHLLQFPPCLSLDASHILLSICSSLFAPPLLHFLILLPHLALLSPLSPFSFCSPLLPLSAPLALPPPPSAHVDTSTVAFDVDPIDLDVEEPPEFQGEPRSSKGISGSVTSPQANIHRLPFFKKVTLGAQDTLLTSPASLLHLSPYSFKLRPGLISHCSVRLSLTHN